ncbi:MAG: hypothetical protein BGN92_04450 [Sphingobacteriales bacterium 41-5]|nr:MAG: hypothetical protein BGN92_04450 [Sphingobacteriales bacterium 41-5]
MKFALVDDIRAQATKGAKAICPNCGSEVIAKCGDVKVHHWAHKSMRNCDPWWENETEWHRAWKNYFPVDWQDRIHYDELTGEKHIADLKTEHGLVIEFQHSFLNAEERGKREDFYKYMVWVVDATRLKKDLTRFIKGKNGFRSYNDKASMFAIDYREDSFPFIWIDSDKPVIFDFKGMEENNDPDLAWRESLFILFPKTNVRESIVAEIKREIFINGVITGSLFKHREKDKKETPLPSPPIQKALGTSVRQSQYILQRGKFVKSSRW